MIGEKFKARDPMLGKKGWASEDKARGLIEREGELEETDYNRESVRSGSAGLWSTDSHGRMNGSDYM